MILSRTKRLTFLLRHYELTNENVSFFLTNQSKTKTFIDLKVTRNPKPTKIAYDLILMKFHRKLMRYHSSLFMRSRQKVMTSATLIYSPHLNEIPPPKRGLTGPSYTTDLAVMQGSGHYRENMCRGTLVPRFPFNKTMADGSHEINCSIF